MSAVNLPLSPQLARRTDDGEPSCRFVRNLRSGLKTPISTVHDFLGFNYYRYQSVDFFLNGRRPSRTGSSKNDRRDAVYHGSLSRDLQRAA
jgi:hypothetical protein